MLNRNDLSILIQMNECKSTNEVTALTIRQLQNITNLSNTKVRYTIRELSASGHILEGLMYGNASTYYISDKGIEILNNYCLLTK